MVGRQRSSTDIAASCVKYIHKVRAQNGKRSSNPLEELALICLVDATKGNTPRITFEFEPDLKVHGEFGRDLVHADLLQLPFEQVLLTFPAKMLDGDKAYFPDQSELPSFAFVRMITREGLLDFTKRLVTQPTAERLVAWKAALANAWATAGNPERAILYIGGMSSTEAGIDIIDGIAMAYMGQESLERDAINMSFVQPSDILCAKDLQREDARTGGYVSKAMMEGVRYGVHAVVALMASLLCREVELVSTGDVTNLNKRRKLSGKPPLETQHVVRIRDSVTKAIEAAKHNGVERGPIRAHFRRGHIRRWTDKTGALRLIPIPPCIVNADSGTPIMPDYVVDVPRPSA